MYENLIDNKNAEKWTLNNSLELFEKCLKTAKDTSLDCNDFIGEVAQVNGVTITTLDYIKNKFPELETIYKEIKSNCEANCFRNGKKGNIIPSLAIMNLKSNHGWTDRLDTTTKNKEVSTIIHLGNGINPDE